MKRITAILIVLLIPALAFGAKPEARTIVAVAIATAISSVDLSSGPVTSTMDTRGFSLIKFQVRLVRGGLAEDVNIKCEESDDGITFSKITSTDAAGVVTELSLTFPTTVTVNFTVRPDITGFKNTRCTLTGLNATSSDLVTLLASGVRGI